MVRSKPIFLLISSLALLAVVSGAALPRRGATALRDDAWQNKVDPWVLETAAEGETEFLVFLQEQADLSGAAALGSKQEKGAYVFQQLSETAARTQAALIAELEAQGLAFRPYWVANMIWVRGSTAAVERLARRADVAHVYANPQVKADIPTQAALNAIESPDAIEWNVRWINADDVWALGYTGQGAVIGGQDTGYDWDHPALVNQYRGSGSPTSDHNYNWHDAIHTGGSDCGADSPIPCDDHGHGTHTMGTMVGDDGGSNQIGVAPGARWIGCRNMNEGVGTPATYAECYQWFIAPTDLNGENPRPDLAPDVINNSWGCPISEGCTDPNVLLTVVQNVRAAGILTVHSAGNSGSGCESIDEPAAIYDASFTVGATGYQTNAIATYSSRGAVEVDGSFRIKPDISAPGSSVRSSVLNNTYGTLSGTSMAAPHVAGLAALLISANPGLAGEVDALENGITQSAHPQTTTQDCSGVDGNEIPNNTYGWGTIDALAAYQAITGHELDLRKTASADTVHPGDLLSYTLTVTHSHAFAPAGSAVITDTIPAGTTFVSASEPYELAGGTQVVWQKSEPLGAEESWSVELVVQVNAESHGPILNDTYSASSDYVSEVAGEPLSTEVLPEYTLSLAKEACTCVVSTGSLLTYTLSSANLSSWQLPLHGVALSDTIPAGTVFVSASAPYTQTGEVITWQLAELANGQTWQVELVVGVPLGFEGFVANEIYGIFSEETGFLAGLPVYTPTSESYHNFLPLLGRSGP